MVKSQVRFNRVLEKVPKKFQRRFGRLCCRARSGSTGLRRRFPEKVWEALVQSLVGGFGAEPGQVQRGSGEGSGEGLGGFGAEPGQVEQGSGEDSGEGLVQSQVRFKRVPGKVPGEGLGGFGADTGQVQQKFSRVPEKVSEKVCEALVQSQVKFNRVPEKVLEKVPEKVSEKVPGGFGAEPGQVQRAPEGCHRRFWESLVKGKVRFNGFNRVSSAWLRSTLQNDL